MIYFYTFIVLRIIEFVLEHCKSKVVFTKELEKRLSVFNMYTGAHEERKKKSTERSFQTQSLIYKLEERVGLYDMFINICRYLQFFSVCWLYIELDEIKLPLW